MDAENARRALHDLKLVLDRHNLKVWLDCGTLLGAVRDGVFIPWDNDVDLAGWMHVLDCVGKESLCRDLNAQRFDVYTLRDKIVMERDQVPINISLYYPEGLTARRCLYPLHTNSFNKIIRTIWWIFHAQRIQSDINPPWSLGPTSLAKRTSLTLVAGLPTHVRKPIVAQAYRLCLAAGGREIDWRVPLHFFEAFDHLKFYSDQWLVPKDYHRYLEFRFGVDWRTPRKDFSTIAEDGAVSR